MTQVFISYSRKDLTFVEQLASDLKRAGLEVWYDLSRLEGGERWRIEIQNAIKSSQYVIVVLSPDSVESEWVEREFLFSSNLKRKIIPLLYRECEIPLNYLDLNYIDVQGGNYQRNFGKILKVLNVDSVVSNSSASPAPKPSDLILVKKSTNSKKTRIGVGIVVAFSSIALVGIAMFFLIGKGNFDQPSTASVIPKMIKTTSASIIPSFTSTPRSTLTPRPNTSTPIASFTPSATVTPSPTPLSEIGQQYFLFGGEGGILGAPVGPEQSTQDGLGRFRKFQGGSIYWSPSTGAHEVHGYILSKWESLGSEKSFLGYPLTDESTTPDGIGRFNHFQAGSIYWTPNTGAHEVHGLIRDKWEALGWETSFLGYPLTDESTTPDGIGRFNHFQAGSIYWTPNTGAHEVHGFIRDKWEALGWERSCLGYPISDEEPASGGWIRQSRFEHGVIKWSPDQGAVEFCF